MKLTRRGFTTLAAVAVAGTVAACTGPTPSDEASPVGDPTTGAGTDPGTGLVIVRTHVCAPEVYRFTSWNSVSLPSPVPIT